MRFLQQTLNLTVLLTFVEKVTQKILIHRKKYEKTLTWQSGKTRCAGLNVLSSHSSSSHFFVISVIQEYNLNNLYEEEQDTIIHNNCSKGHLGQWLKRN